MQQSRQPFVARTFGQATMTDEFFMVGQIFGKGEGFGVVGLPYLSWRSVVSA